MLAHFTALTAFAQPFQLGEAIQIEAMRVTAIERFNGQPKAFAAAFVQELSLQFPLPGLRVPGGIQTT